MDHMKKYWPYEMNEIREAAKKNLVKLVDHSEDRMETRNISNLDLMLALLTGVIVEGHDVGQYPKYRNANPRRTILGYGQNNKKIRIGLAICKNDYKIVTCMEVDENSRFFGLFSDEDHAILNTNNQ